MCKTIYSSCLPSLKSGFVWAGENEDEKLNEVMYEAWRFNRDCKQLRDGLQGLSWDGQCEVPLVCSVYGS